MMMILNLFQNKEIDLYVGIALEQKMLVVSPATIINSSSSIQVGWNP